MQYKFPVVGAADMVVTSDEHVVRLHMEGVDGGHTLLLPGRVDLERLSRMATFARCADLVDFDERALPALLWHLTGLHSLDEVGEVDGYLAMRADDGLVVLPINAIIRMARRADDFQAMIERPVEIVPELLSGVLSGEVQPDLMTAQDDILRGRLVYTDQLAALRLMSPSEWPAVDIQLGLISHRVAEQMRRLLRSPSSPLSIAAGETERAEALMGKVARTVVEQMHWDSHACQHMRWAALRALRLLIHSGCPVDNLTICPGCAQVRAWLAESGPEVMGDTAQPRPSADELNDLLAQIDKSLS